MKYMSRATLAALLLLSQPAFADEAPQRQDDKWVQDYTGRQADPAVRFGTLPNGLRYAIMRNTTPADGVAMRMRIGSGSIEERDEERGLAHFLEHMAFRGSTNVPDGEVVRMLQRLGLQFGPDTNAATSQEQTVYMFNFPKADAASLDTGLMLFREIGGRLKLDDTLVEAEKGVILSEERLRDTPPYRALKANLGNALAGTRAVQRWPIGTIDTIKAATGERLRRYYNANYRPDNATLIVVGNIDPAKVETEIKARFADWRPAGTGDDIDLGTPAPKESAAEHVEAGTQDLVTLSWIGPVDRRAFTEAVERERFIQLVGLTVLNNRLADRAAKPGSPFVAGQAAQVPALVGTASLTQIAIVGAPDKWREAVDAVAEEQRRLVETGIGAAELERAKTVLGTYFETLASQAATRENAKLADTLLQTVNESALFTSPAQDLVLVRDVLSKLTADEATTALRAAFVGKGPILFRSAQTGPATVPVLSAGLAEAYARPLAAQAQQAAIVWPYTDFGKAGTVLSRSEDEQLGTTLVTFANGARLLVKRTPFEEGKIRVAAWFGAGRKGAPAELARALWAVDLFSVGGTGKLSTGDVTQWAQTSGKSIAIAATADRGGFALTGTTRPADFESQMELLAAFASDPGFRPELGEKIAAVAPMVAGQVEANAGAMFNLEVDRVTTGGDTRFASLPAPADLSATKADDVVTLLRPALAGPADVTIVGDISVDDAIAATAKTFGALKVENRPASTDVHIAPLAARNTPYVVTHSGRADQAFYGVYWPMPDYQADPALSYTADVASAILQSRLVDTVREKIGITYSPQVSSLASLQLPGQGYIGAAIETPEANFTAFRAILDQELAAMAAKPVSDDEFERALQPLIESATKRLENNEYWIGRLPLILRNPALKQSVTDEVSGLQAVSAAKVQDMIRRFVTVKKPLVVISKAK